jgi:hypothetical protein
MNCPETGIQYLASRIPWNLPARMTQSPARPEPFGRGRGICILEFLRYGKKYSNQPHVDCSLGFFPDG